MKVPQATHKTKLYTRASTTLSSSDFSFLTVRAEIMSEARNPGRRITDSLRVSSLILPSSPAFNLVELCNYRFLLRRDDTANNNNSKAAKSGGQSLWEEEGLLPSRS